MPRFPMRSVYPLPFFDCYERLRDKARNPSLLQRLKTALKHKPETRISKHLTTSRRIWRMVEQKPDSIIPPPPISVVVCDETRAKIKHIAELANNLTEERRLEFLVFLLSLLWKDKDAKTNEYIS